jgi:hypothetical protein
VWWYGAVSSLPHGIRRYHSWCGEDTPLSSTLVQFGRTLNEIQTSQTVMLTTLEGTLSMPLQEFVASEVKPIEDVVKLCEAARADVDVAAGKYLRVRCCVSIARYPLR